MEKIRSFFSRFKDEKGFGILGLLTVVALISLAVSLHSVGEYSIGQHAKVQKNFTDMQNLPDAADTTDANKSYYQAKKSTVDAFKKIGEDTIGMAVDDTAILGIIKETGVFDLPKAKTEEIESKSVPVLKQGLLGALKGYAGDTDDFAILEILDENNLPTDAITQDITKIVINVTNQLASSDSEIADIIDTSIDVIKDLINKDKNEGIDYDSTKALEIVKEKLDDINKLEDEETINKRKEYNLSVLEKEQLEKEIVVYEHYKDTDTVIISDKTYVKIQQRLDHLNDKISGLEKELQEYAGNSEDVLTDEETQDTSTGDDTSTDTENGESSSDYGDDPFGFGDKDVDLPEQETPSDWDFRMDEDGNWSWYHYENGFWYKETYGP